MCDNPTSTTFDNFVKELLLSLAEKTPESESLLYRFKFLIAAKFLSDLLF